MKKHYQILVAGNFGKFDKNIVDVVCTKDDLDIIAGALINFVISLGCGCTCVAKEGDGVSFSNWDIMYSDCI